MANSGRRLFTTWVNKNTGIKQLRKKTRFNSHFSACMISSWSGIPRNNDLQCAQTSNISLRRVPSNSGTKNVFFMDLQKICSNTNIRDVISERLPSRRWISSSCVCLNEEKSSMSSGKSKLKERIEKVKEMVHVRKCLFSCYALLIFFHAISLPIRTMKFGTAASQKFTQPLHKCFNNLSLVQLSDTLHYFMATNGLDMQTGNPLTIFYPYNALMCIHHLRCFIVFKKFKQL